MVMGMPHRKLAPACVRHPTQSGQGAFIPAPAAAAVLILRTALEDRLLRRELPGYEAYARKVRYRLLPGVW